MSHRTYPSNLAKLPILIAPLLALLVALPARAADTDKEVVPEIVKPNIPDKTFKITDYGANGDGTTMNTDAIKKAIAACTAAGGGIVEIPQGKFLTGPFQLASSLNLHLDDGATLLISDKTADYKLTNNRYENCIDGVDLHDVAITGGGTIDGQGELWWKTIGRRGAPASSPHRPYLIFLNRCTRLQVKDIHLVNSPMFHLVPQACTDVLIDGITIHDDDIDLAHNTDGIDPSGHNYLIENCKIDTGDDNIALKPANRELGEDKPSCDNFFITDCTFNHGHGMSIGGQTPDGLRNLTVRNCTFDGTDAGIRMKAARGSGGVVENLNYHDLKMKNVKVAIDILSWYPKAPPNVMTAPAESMAATTPVWRHIRITNVTSEDGTGAAGSLLGLPEAHISDIVLTNVHLSAKKGMTILHADGIKFVDSDIKVQQGSTLVETDANVEGLTPSAPVAGDAD